MGLPARLRDALGRAGPRVGKVPVMPGGSDVSPRKRNKAHFNAFRVKNNDGELRHVYFITCVPGVVLLQPVTDGGDAQRGSPHPGVTSHWR